MKSEFVYVDDLGNHVDRQVTVRGWLTRKRSSGKIRFLVLRDGTGSVQCVAAASDVSAEDFERLGRLPLESSLAVTGTVRVDERAARRVRAGPAVDRGDPRGRRVPDPAQGARRRVPVRPAPPLPALAPAQAVLRVRHEVVQACRDFFYDRGYVNIDSPILTPAACEGTSTLFETDYFGTQAYLAQSGQLYLEPACMAFGKVYCFGPTFRAEKAKTRRHLTEFWMIEPEVAFLELPGLLELAEDFVSYVVGRVVERCRSSLEVPRAGPVQARGTSPHPSPADLRRGRRDPHHARSPGGDARGRGAAVRTGERLRRFDETFLTQRFERPVMVTHWPAEIKAFYMQPAADDPGKALCVDMLAPEGYGEIIGGSQRVHDHDLLLRRIREHELPVEAFQWYLDIRKYGTVPHSGFGMGLERFVTWICGIPHLREAIPYPRQIHRLYP